MNPILQNLLNDKPSQQDLYPHYASLHLLASCVNDEFLDVPQKPSVFDPHTDGLYCEIPYLQNNDVTNHDLLVLWDVIDGKSTQPLRLSFDYQDDANITIHAHFQFESGDVTKPFITKKDNRISFEDEALVRTTTLFELVYIPVLP